MRKQVDVGIDIVDDGEMSKPSFITYINERLGGFELDTTDRNQSPWVGSREVKEFPDYYGRNWRTCTPGTRILSAPGL